MLELKSKCENCGKLLPHDSNEAMICSFECTFCIDCVNTILNKKCPDCGGNFEKRPTRGKRSIENTVYETTNNIFRTNNSS